MKVALPQIAVGKETYATFNACVHCGLCLPACPTYMETLNEAESPRGRIHLMRAAVDGRMAPSAAMLQHLESCLVCRACETACPSTVVYHDLIETVRPQVARAVRGRGMRSRMLDFVVSHVLPFPRRAALAVFPLRLARKVGLGGLARRMAGALARPLGEMAAVLPDGPLFSRRPPAFTAARGQRRGSVVLLLGCIGSVVSGATNAAAAEVLAWNGFDVHLLGGEPCCGALAAHANEPAGAERFARTLVETLTTLKEDYFISPIAGCGAQLKSLGHVLAGAGSGQLAEQAQVVAGKMRDICEFLAEVGLRSPRGRVEKTVTYHDPCHLVHAQKISAAPRTLLRAIPGLKLVPLVDADMCCGAAGTYNLSEPEMAKALGKKKAACVAATGAVVCATANVGCELQISRSLRKAGSDISVQHVVTLLAESYAAAAMEGADAA